jgi:predicted TIM-barrel fold metal-dependent hydrolase
VIAVMRKHRHVLAETNWMATVGAIEDMVEAVGADRLLFGSGAPFHPIQKALNQVLETDLDEGAKAAILGGNAVRVFGIERALLAGRPRLSDLRPRAFDQPIVDVHSHLGHWRIPIRNEGYDPAGMIGRMKRFGIATTVASSYEGMRFDIRSGNRRLAEAIEGHPEIQGYVELDPHHLELSCAEMDAWYRSPSFAGAELELSHIPCPTGSEKVRRLVAEVARRGKPVLFMPAGPDDAAAERELAREHPGLTIIHAHGFDASWASVVADTPNVCVEFNRSRAFHHDIADCRDILGPERILFGSDQTLLSLGAALGLYRDAGLSPSDQRLVLSENARRIFGFAGPDRPHRQPGGTP